MKTLPFGSSATPSTCPISFESGDRETARARSGPTRLRITGKRHSPERPPKTTTPHMCLKKLAKMALCDPARPMVPSIVIPKYTIFGASLWENLVP